MPEIRFKVCIEGIKSVKKDAFKKAEWKNIKEFSNAWCFLANPIDDNCELPFVPVTIFITKGKKEFNDYCEEYGLPVKFPSYLPLPFIRRKGMEEGCVILFKDGIQWQFEQRKTKHSNLKRNFEEVAAMIQT